jgi:hypothetical protein
MAHLRKAALTPVSAMPSVEVADEQCHEWFRFVDEETRAAMLELVGEVGECVEAGSCDDVEVGLLGHSLDPGDVATETHDRRVEDRIDPRGFEVIELGRRRRRSLSSSSQAVS